MSVAVNVNGRTMTLISIRRRRCCGSCARTSASPARSTAAAWRNAAHAPSMSTASRCALLDAGGGGRRPQGDDDRGPVVAGAQAVQRAWVELDVVQCGYCQSGQIMSATALLEKKPKPDRRRHRSAMAGNICRCATYQRIRAAIHAAAKQLKA